MKNKYLDMQNEIEEKFGYQPYEYLSCESEYQSKKSTIKLKCKKCGYIFDYKPADILRPRIDKPVCKECSRINRINILTERGKEEFFKLLEENYPDCYTYSKDEYKGNHEKMNFICNKCNDVVSVTPNNIKNNIRLNREYYCNTCSSKRLSEQKTNTKEKCIERLEKKFPNRYSLLEYNGMTEDCKFKCNECNAEFTYKPEKLLSYKHPYCPDCSNGFKHDKRDYLQRCFEESHGKIIPIERFINNRTKILHKCVICDHEWKATPGNIVINHTCCPKCKNSYTVSAGEIELRNFIKEIYNGKIDINNRLAISPKELDIYLPELNLAFEYCGLYWHNEDHKGKNYHLDKLELCTKKNIRLITIFEDEWINNKELVKNKIKHLMKLNTAKKINARQCYIREINKKECDQLLNNNHLQGADRASIRLGLFYKNDLVAAMTFCAPRVSTGSAKSKLKIDYELSRYVSDVNYIINGSFGKLFSYFKKNYKWKTIITYADKRWSDGNLYFKNGFINTHDSKPNYFYVHRNDGTKRIHRFMYRKSAIKNKHPEIYNESLTEREMTKLINLYRIYDCGNKVFIYKKGAD